MSDRSDNTIESGVANDGGNGKRFRLLARLVLVVVTVALLLLAKGNNHFLALSYRQTQYLNDNWQIKISSNETLAEPGNWDAVNNYVSAPQMNKNSDSSAWYKKTFTVPSSWDGQSVYLRFDSVRYIKKLRLQVGANTYVLVGDSSAIPNGTFDGLLNTDGQGDGDGHIYADAVSPIEFNLSNLVAADGSTVHSLYLYLEKNPELWNDKYVNPSTGGGWGSTTGVDIYWGIWEDVYLKMSPKVFVSDVFVKTQVTGGNQISAEITLTNNDTIPHTVDIVPSVESLSGGITQKSLTTIPGQLVPANSSLIVLVSVHDWAEAVYWNPEDSLPQLYNFKAALRENNLEIESFTQRFGFREFKIASDGQRKQFYLNGQKIHLRSAFYLSRARFGFNEIYDWRALVQKYKGQGVNTIRYSTAFLADYDLADELGMMIIDLSAIAGDSGDEAVMRNSFSTNYDPYWDNASAHLVSASGIDAPHNNVYVPGIIRAHRNHPSVIVWGAANEELNQYGYSEITVDGKQEYIALAGKIKAVDSSRPLTYEGDYGLKPINNGTQVDDIMNVHYPYEMPFMSLTPYNTYWLENSSSPYNVLSYPGPVTTMEYNPYNEILMIGEYAWSVHPNSTCNPAWADPKTSMDCYSYFMGDNIYTYGTGLDGIVSANNPLAYQNLYLQELIRMFTPAYRRLQVTAMPILNRYTNNDVLGEVYKPVTVFIKEKNKNFFVGALITKTASVINDSLSSKNITLSWQLAYASGEIIAQGNGSGDGVYQPAEIKDQEISFTLPTISSKTAINLTLDLTADGVIQQQLTDNYYVYPVNNAAYRIADLPDTGAGKPKIGILYETGMDTLTKTILTVNLAELGAAVVDVPRSNFNSTYLTVNNINIAIVGDNADIVLDSSLKTWVGDGGKLIVFKQNGSYSADPPSNPLYTNAYNWLSISDSKTCPTEPGASILSAVCLRSHPRHTWWLANNEPIMTDRAFISDSSHPIVNGISETDLRYWYGDGSDNYIVVENGINYPFIQTASQDGFVKKIIYASGGPSFGTDIMGLAEVKYKKGFYILSQLDLGDKFTTDPIANQIFKNILDYAASQPPVYRKKVGYFYRSPFNSGNQPYKYLVSDNAILVEGSSRDNSLVKLDIANLGTDSGSIFLDYHALLIDQDILDNYSFSSQQIDVLQNFVSGGGKIIFTNVTSSNKAKVESIVGYALAVSAIANGDIPFSYNYSPNNLVKAVANRWVGYSVMSEVPGTDIVSNKVVVSNPDENVMDIVAPGALIQILSDNGAYLISQFNFSNYSSPNYLYGNLGRALAHSIFAGVTEGNFSSSLYVNKSLGNDNNDGSLSYPLKTIASALTKAVPGTTVYVRAGIYQESQLSFFNNGLSSANRITLRGYGAEEVVLDGTGFDANGIVVSGKNYINLSNLTLQNFTGSDKSCLFFSNSSYVSVKNVVFNNCRTGITFDSSHRADIWNNTFYANNIGLSISNSSSYASLYNNTASHNNSYALSVGSQSTTGLVSNYNNWFNSSGTSPILWTGNQYFKVPSQDSNSKNADPTFVDASVGNFQLLSSSTLVDAGFDLGLAYNGSAADIGAFESSYQAAGESQQENSQFEISVSSGGGANYATQKVAETLTISNLKALTVDVDKVRVSWRTNHEAKPKIVYWTVDSFSTSTAGSATTSKSFINKFQNYHVFELANLHLNADYQYEIVLMASDESTLTVKKLFFSTKNFVPEDSVGGEMDKDAFLKESENTLLRAISDIKVYVIKSFKKFHIPNPDIFNLYKYKWTDIVTTTVDNLNLYQDINLIRASNDYKVYRLEPDGTRRWIKNEEIFIAYGYDWREVLVVLPEVSEVYPLGSVIDTSPVNESNTLLFPGRLMTAIFSAVSFIFSSSSVYAYMGGLFLAVILIYIVRRISRF